MIITIEDSRLKPLSAGLRTFETKQLKDFMKEITKLAYERKLITEDMICTFESNKLILKSRTK